MDQIPSSLMSRFRWISARWALAIEHALEDSIADAEEEAEEDDALDDQPEWHFPLGGGCW